MNPTQNDYQKVASLIHEYKLSLYPFPMLWVMDLDLSQEEIQIFLSRTLNQN